MADRWRPHGILVEDRASGQSLIQDMREDGLPAIPIQPEANKQIRMDNQAPMLEAGLVLLPERAEWLYEFEQEAVHFPKSKHDDQIDALSQFLKWSRNASLEFLSVGGDEWAEVAKEMGDDPDDWDEFDDDFD
jgi:phage terminase large subunit-like protein